MKVSIITPNYNSGRFLDSAMQSVLQQRGEGVSLEYIVVDGGSTDGSLAILDRYRGQIDRVISEPDGGPASAINKGLRLASGELLGWLNADDCYHAGALRRAVAVMSARPRRALCFGRCRIVDEEGREIRRGITRFKELCFPLSSRFMIQSINYVSQPAMFFRRSAFEAAGFLREDLQAAWDYEFVLRLWRRGGAARVPGGPLADFRWRPDSISGRAFTRQFAEEWEAAARDAGRYSPQALIHRCVRWGIVAAYSRMAARRRGTR
jgi:glycosyltransferase involved in cell wall biosynthesis